jgi:filamentous hemagglutinin family protein
VWLPARQWRAIARWPWRWPWRPVLPPNPLRAQPVAAQAIHGAATLSRSGANLTVTTQNGAGTNHSAINWQSFNVPGGSTTHFAQPGAASTSINRVLGNNPSAIFGTLSSNGRLVLVNPSGIAVGAGAVVDTAGFTASTLRMSDADALAGRMRFGQDGLGGGSLSVQGRVVARGGDVVLIAPQVDTGAQAVVQASGGDTLLVAGQKVELTGRGLEGIHLQLQAPADRALNLGALKGDSVGVFASQLRHSGLVQAQTATVQGGKVLLRGQVSADVTAA